jgi:hypothetical protein
MTCRRQHLLSFRLTVRGSIPGIRPSPHTHERARVTHNFTPDMKTLGWKWEGGEGKEKG